MKKSKNSRLMKETILVIQSTAKPIDTNIFYRTMMEEAEREDQRPKNPAFRYDPPVWEDAPDFNATGMPDFLPGSGK